MDDSICQAEGCDRERKAKWQGGKSYCNLHWLRLYKYGSLNKPLRKIVPPNPPCIVDGCGLVSRSRNSKYCERHYYRKRRGKDPTVDPSYAYRCVNRAGYQVLFKCFHPLAAKCGRVYEHRKVAYDFNGGVCPNCFWCCKSLSWENAVVDHLNEIKHDNRVENLVVACNECNRARGAMIPFVKSLSEDGVAALIKSFKFMRAK